MCSVALFRLQVSRGHISLLFVSDHISAVWEEGRELLSLTETQITAGCSYCVVGTLNVSAARAVCLGTKGTV